MTLTLKVTEINCKTALSRSGIYGWSYAINPYRGCGHGCIYCYAPNILRQPRSHWGGSVDVRMNMPTVLSKELKRIASTSKFTPALVGISSVTDPYQRIEEKYRVTRHCLEQLLRYRFPISIITKSPLILRDLDLLKKFAYSEITITITSMDEQISHVLEPNAPSLSERLDALTKLSAEGLNTYAFLGPLLPILEYDHVPAFIEKILNTGVKTVMVDTLNLKPGIWPEIERVLDSRGLIDIKNTIKHRLFKDKMYYPKLFELIKQECERRGAKFE
jgi:DNA repair photolyase